MTLLDHPWLEMYGATDLDTCVEIVREFLVSKGLSSVDEAASKLADRK